MTDTEFLGIVTANAADMKTETLLDARKFLVEISQVVSRIKFGVGDLVSFTGRNKETMTGLIMRMNRTTATVLAKNDHGGATQTWRVSLAALQAPMANKTYTEIPL